MGEKFAFTLKEGHSFRVFENRVLRIFGPRRQKTREMNVKKVTV
jgi:hypothetical protein